MKVAVIGGGPAGMTAAIKLGLGGVYTDLYEKNEKLGKKLYITGKGRCNITNDCDEAEFMRNVLRNPKFMYKAIFAFPPEKTMEFIESEGVPVKTERGNRVFPLSDKSSDIIKAFTGKLTKAKVNVKLNKEVTTIEKTPTGFKILTKSAAEEYDKVVVATGGITYRQTGSTGDGYKFAEKFGHSLVQPVGALNALISDDNYDLAGLSLKNVTFNVEKKGKLIFSEQGEMLFTHKGVSGPIVLTASSVIARENFKELTCYVDLKPALTDEVLDLRLLRDFAANVNKQFKSALDALLPQRLINAVIKVSAIAPDKKVNSVTKTERERLLNALKRFPISVTGLADVNEGIITAGGITVNEINPQSMESKLVNGLFFVGEVLDVDAKTGGFNLQIAISTANLCGEYIVKNAEVDR